MILLTLYWSSQYCGKFGACEGSTSSTMVHQCGASSGYYLFSLMIVIITLLSFHVDELPTLNELMILKYKEGRETKEIRIIMESVCKWKDIAGLISDDPNRISVLERHHDRLEDCLQQVLVADFISKKPEDYSQDWNGLLKVLEDVKLTPLAQRVKYALLHEGTCSSYDAVSFSRKNTKMMNLIVMAF